MQIKTQNAVIWKLNKEQSLFRGLDSFGGGQTGGGGVRVHSPFPVSTPGEE